MSQIGGDGPAPAGERPIRRWKFSLWYIPLILILILVVGVFLWRGYWQHAFDARVAALAAAGYPMTPAELDASYTWPASGENAADWVVGAGSYFVELPRKEGEQLRDLFAGSRNPVSRDPLSDELGELLERHVQSNAKALELLHRAATVAECRYSVDLSDSRCFLLHIEHVRNGCQLLCLEAIFHGERGESEKAVRAMEAAFGIADTLRHEPIFISQLIRQADARWVIGAIERVLSQTELTDEQLGRLAAAILPEPEPEHLKRLLAGVCCQSLPWFDRPETMDPQLLSKPPHAAVLELYDALGLATRDGVVFLDMIDECLAAADLPFHERNQAARDIEKHFVERSRRSILFKEFNWVWHGLKGEVSYVAVLRCSRAALAAERFRLKEGRYPETLADLVSTYLDAVPQDPYDDTPLKYERVAEGAVISSVGDGEGGSKVAFTLGRQCRRANSHRLLVLPGAGLEGRRGIVVVRRSRARERTVI